MTITLYYIPTPATIPSFQACFQVSSVSLVFFLWLPKVFWVLKPKKT